MGQRVIPVAVTAEYIGGDGVTLGAAGSHNSVVIEYDFRSAGPMWDPPEGGSLVKYVLWTNPQGNTTNRVDLGVDKIVDGFDGKVYHASPTADAMCVAGWAEMVVVGAVVDNSTTPPTEVLKVKTEPSRFRVLPGSSRAADNEGIAATVADQMEAEIEAINANLDAKKVNNPVEPNAPNGVAGQILESLGDGKTRWRDEKVATSEAVEQALEDHPEWTTTVDFAVTHKVLDTVWDMVEDATLSVGDHVLTSGYYQNRDGGAAEYKVREIAQEDSISETADGTTSRDGLVRLASSGLCAELIMHGELNFLCAGVKRNTNADQFTALYRALHIPGVNRFYLPEGRYITSDTLLVPAYSELFGDGKESVLYYNGEHSALGTGLGNGGSGVSIHDLSVEHVAHVNGGDIYSGDTIFMLKDGAALPSDFLGGIGFSCLLFDGWTDYIDSGRAMSARDIGKQSCTGLMAYRIYSSSCYPLQTEPGATSEDPEHPSPGYFVQDVVYRDIFAPNGMVSLYPQEGNGKLKNAYVDNVDCFLFRVGIGYGTGYNINLNNITAKLCYLLDNGITARNITVDGTRSGHCNWYQSALRIGGDEINLDQVTAQYGDSYQPHGITSVAQIVKMSNSSVRGFTRSWVNGGYEPLEVHFSNCDFDGIIGTVHGTAVNCRGAFPERVTQDTFSSKRYQIPSGGTLNVPFKYQGIILARRNSHEESAVSMYLATYADSTLLLTPILDSEIMPVTASYNAETETLTVTNGASVYADVSLIYF